MIFGYFNLKLVERKRTFTYDFARKANLNSLHFGIGIKVYFALEGSPFVNSKIFV